MVVKSKLLYLLAPLWCMAVWSGGHLQAATTATATITYSVQAIDTIAVSGNPAALSISSAVAGSNPNSSTDTTTTYAITTNSSVARAIQGSLSGAMPTGLTLKVSMQAPTGGTSAGSVTMTTSNANLVTGITQVAQGSLQITYTLQATPTASVVSNATVTVTYTLS
jgi:hypothetical protein